MNTSFALITAGIIFAIAALMHLLRLIYKTQVIVGGKILPIWASVLGLIIALILSIWMFIAA